MQLSTEILYEIDNSEWNSFISKNPASTAHQKAGIYKPLELAFNSKQAYILVKNSKGNVVGQLTVVINFEDMSTESNIFSKLIYGPMLTWNHGPIIHDYSIKDKIVCEILQAIEKLSNENKVAIIKGRSLPLSEPIPNNIFEKFGYSCEPWLAYIANIDKSVDEFFLSLHNKIRYDIRKGEKNDLQFELVNSINSLNEYNNFNFSNDKNKDKIINRFQTFNELRFNFLIKSGDEQIFLARLDNEIVGGMGNYSFNNNVVQHTVTNSSNKKLNAGSFLTWNAIKWSIENKFLTYDMGGANPNPVSEKERGIKHYKSKWNGQEITYTLYTKIVNKTKWKISKGLKQPSKFSKKLFGKN